MQGKPLYLPGFSHHLQGSRARSASAKLSDTAPELDGLAALIAKFIPATLFAPGRGRRDRVFSPWVTFCAFLGQVLSRGSSCRDALRRVQAWRFTAAKSVPTSGTSAYCQARERLEVSWLHRAFAKLCAWMDMRTNQEDLWCGRLVKIIDGTGISMPDSDANRADMPYPGGQKPGCGFPAAKLLGIFSLATGALVNLVIGSWKRHDIAMARELAATLQPGEVLLGDRGFCGYGFLAMIVCHRADVVVRVSGARKLAKQCLQKWRKPQQPKGWTPEDWAPLPKELSLRIVRFKVQVPGFRTQVIVLATTLLDQNKFSDQALQELYLRRWQVELCFRDIKVTLGLDVLRCKSPNLIEKEIWLQAIAYNLVRALMLEAARAHDVPLWRLSFKGTVDSLRHWTSLMGSGCGRPAKRAALLELLAADLLPIRPNRSEPRTKKRRPKTYQLMTKPRRKMVVAHSRRKK